MPDFSITVDSSYDDTRIDSFLKKKCGFSSSLVSRVKFVGVFINGENVHMRAKVFAGDTVDVFLPKEASEGITPLNIPLEIIYEDDFLLVVNKPRNMPTHPSLGNSLPTLAQAVSYYYRDRPFVFRSVNRLDRDTSGIVVIAKNSISASNLGRSMKAGEFTKKYVALLEKMPQNEYGIIDAPIERIEEGSMKRAVLPNGKRAVTEYKVLGKNELGYLCEITLHTGRTHQIRVHMSHIGAPLWNDFLYGNKFSDTDTYRLHAGYISFPHPITKDIVTFRSDADFFTIK